MVEAVTVATEEDARLLSKYHRLGQGPVLEGGDGADPCWSTKLRQDDVCERHCGEAMMSIASLASVQASQQGCL